MFLRRSEAVLLTEEALDGLCPSLNRPVVDVEDFPVGPARSAIALVRDAAGARHLLVSVRAEESGVVTFFEFQGELNPNVAQALDVGLTFAEGMGFLFDDDVLAGGEAGRRRAMEIWCALTGDELPNAPEPASVPPAQDPAAEPVPLLLDDLIEEPDLEEPDLEEPDLEETAPAPEPAAPTLSKFRRPAEAVAAVHAEPTPAPGTSGAQLARIPILRRRRREGEAAPTTSLFIRLLARF